MVRRPRATLAAVAAVQGWAGILAVTTGVSAATAVAFYATPVGRQALVDRWERTAAAVGRELDDAAYAELVRLADYAPLYGVGSAIVNVALLTGLVAALAFIVLPRRAGAPSFRQVMTVASHASVLLALRLVIAAPIAYVREADAGATSLGVLMPGLGQSSTLTRALGMVDPVFAWWCVVAAIGLAIVYGRRPRGLVLAFLGVYAGAVLTLGLVLSVLGPD